LHTFPIVVFTISDGTIGVIAHSI